MPDTYGGYAYGRGEYAGPPVAGLPAVTVDGGLFPTILVEIAPGYGPNDASPVWVNIGGDVTQITTKRGRQRTLNRFEPGRMTVNLDNKSGRYSPFNPSSPYNTLLVPGMPVRFRAIWGAVTYTRFAGFMESLPLTWPSGNDSTVTLTAIDAMKFLGLKKPTSIDNYRAVVAADAPVAWWRGNDAVGSTTMADASGNGRTATKVTTDPTTTSTIPTWHFQAAPQLVADTTSSLDLGYHEVEFSGPTPTINAAGSFSFECWAALRISDAAYFLEGQTGSSSEFALMYDGDQVVWSGPFSPIVTGPSMDTNKVFHLVGTCEQGGGGGPILTLYVNGAQVAQAQSISGPGWSGSITFVRIGGRFGTILDQAISNGIIQEAAVYNYLLTPAQVYAHYSAGTNPRANETTGARVTYLAGYTGMPSTTLAIDTGVSTVQGATDTWLRSSILALMQEQVDTEGGDLFIDASGRLTSFDRYRTSRSPYSSVSLILGDSGTAPEEPYRLESLTVSYDDEDEVNEVNVTPDGLATQTASDIPAQSSGKRTLDEKSVTTSVTEAAGRASYLLNLLKTPQPRIDSVTVVPTDDPTMLFGPVLGSDLLTRVEVRRRPKDGAGSTFDQIALLEGIEDRVVKGQWQTTWRMSALDAYRFFILDDPVAGVLDDPLNILGY